MYILNWKTFLSGAAAGLITGYCLSTKANEKITVSGEKVLANVKHAFKKEGRVDGSWLQMKPEHYQKYAIKTKVYRGGITMNNNGTREQFEFIADAYTGTVLDVYHI
ncbi:PepSY domain-containing protein [Bacillus sp. FSL K6-3431]|uniref:PepSY domain-containing protein n=1 Tax=Bacillus sp. FSL K6-3431 TaxID=2921500 RepID=UPI0030F744F7